MSDHPLRKTAYDVMHQRRQACQLAHFQAVRGRPLAEQARAWFQQWPQRVPDVVWHHMSRAEHVAWLAISQAHKLRQMIDENPTAQPMLLQWRLESLASAATVRHSLAVKEVHAALAKIKGPLTAIVHFSVPEIAGPTTVTETAIPTSFAGEYHADAAGQWGDDAPALNMALALGLEKEGSVIIQQQLPMRVQRPDARGELVWVHQERLYGIGLLNGEWEPAPAQAVRGARSVDGETGLPVAVAAGLSFGDLADLLAPQSPKRQQG